MHDPDIQKKVPVDPKINQVCAKQNKHHLGKML